MTDVLYTDIVVLTFSVELANTRSVSLDRVPAALTILLFISDSKKEGFRDGRA